MEFEKTIINRVKRVEGQVRGIVRMMEEGQECMDVAGQLSAARNALDRTLALIVSQNLAMCVMEEDGDDESKAALIQEAIDLMVKVR